MVDKPLPDWQIFILQVSLVAPLAVVPFWLLISASLGAVLDLRHQALPPDLKAVEDDCVAAAGLICSGVAAGALITSVAPILRRSGQWMLALGLPLSALLAPGYTTYMAHDDRPNHLLAILDWICDPNIYPGYAYIAYSVGARLAPSFSGLTQRFLGIWKIRASDHGSEP